MEDVVTRDWLVRELAAEACPGVPVPDLDEDVPPERRMAHGAWRQGRGDRRPPVEPCHADVLLEVTNEPNGG